MTSELFSGRVGDYAKFRSDYSSLLRQFLVYDFALKPHHVIADVGSGTGLLSNWLLELGNHVFGVEPNAEMRAKAEALFSTIDAFTSVAAPAEHTTLKDHCIDVVTAGNAFHWFDGVAARKEFSRILRGKGRVLLIRTNWVEFPSPVMQEYTKLINHYCVGRSGAASSQALEDKAIADFFHPGPFIKKSLGQSTTLMNLEQVKGRFLSTSFAPLLGHPKHDEAMRALESLFARHHQNESIAFGVITNVAYGELVAVI